MNRAETFLQNARAVCGDERLSALEAGNTPKQQVACIREGLRVLEESGGERLVQQAMRPCRCISRAVLEKAEALWHESHEDMETFLQAMNREGIGGGMLATTDEGDVLARYDKCCCGLAKQGGLPEGYCQCSCGWFQALFEHILGRQVTVTLLHSIVGGAKTCDFCIVWPHGERES